jgi:hypothetical protein
VRKAVEEPVKTHSGVCQPHEKVFFPCCPGFIVLLCLFLNTEQYKQCGSVSSEFAYELHVNCI